MAITPENLAWHELIGLRVRVVESASRPHKGISGTVVDETKNTLVIRTAKGEKMVPKRGSAFRFSLPGRSYAVLDGSRIAFRPYDRPKKVKA